MDRAILESLLAKYRAGSLSDAERQQLDRWYLLEAGAGSPLSDPVAFEKRLAEMDAAFPFVEMEEIRPKRARLWPRVAVAAAIAAMVFGAGLFYIKNTDKVQESVYAADVNPGKQGATLTLADGKKIRLGDAASGKLAEESGVVITKTAGGQLVYEIKDQGNGSDKLNMLTTDNGETYQVRLPDGSSVWLNAASTLKYPASFAKLKERRVELSGEGYFEVTKDRLHPFIVKTGKQEVEVLGTHFNVNAYADEPAIATTLLEGSVRVRADGKDSKVLRPGQQSLNRGDGLKVREVDIESITDWKDGDFNLDQVDFRIAMRKIARWYNVEVVYDESVPDGMQTGGWISRNKKLSTVLKFIESSGLVHFKIEGRKVYVSK